MVQLYNLAAGDDVSPDAAALDMNAEELTQRQKAQKCKWSRDGSSQNLQLGTPQDGGDDDTDWRYLRDPAKDSNIPGLMRLQLVRRNSSLISPRVADVPCLPCPPCSSCTREGTATIGPG